MDWNRLIWQGILVPCVFFFGLLATLRSGAFQILRFPRMWKETLGKLFSKERKGEGSVSPFQALCTALGGTVGTGSVVGTCQALAVGGPGALFWLWIAAFFGMIIKFFEVCLAIHFRKKRSDGEWVGGPMYYITEGMGARWKPLAVLFSVFAILSSLGMGCMAQANGVTEGVRDTLNVFFSLEDRGGEIAVWVGLFLGVFLGFALFGGAGRIGTILLFLIPFASLLFIGVTVVVILCHADRLGEVLSLTVRAAFSDRALWGAGSGITAKMALEWGLRRSAFSNEAGLGSAAIAHASAQTEHPVSQGFFGMFEVFVDTMVVCTLTGLTVLVSLPLERIFASPLPDATLITEAVATVFGDGFSRAFLGISLALFALSTLLGWSLYGSRTAQFLFGAVGDGLYRVIYLLCAAFGSFFALSQIWALSDLFNALMAIPNFIALFSLFGVVLALIRDYEEKEQKAMGKKKRKKV